MPQEDARDLRQRRLRRWAIICWSGAVVFAVIAIILVATSSSFATLNWLFASPPVVLFFAGLSLWRRSDPVYAPE